MVIFTSSHSEHARLCRAIGTIRAALGRDVPITIQFNGQELTLAADHEPSSQTREQTGHLDPAGDQPGNEVLPDPHPVLPH